MILKDEKEVKKWLRNLANTKRELELKIEFYSELKDDLSSCERFKKHKETYEQKIEMLNEEIINRAKDTERLFALLTDEERIIMTARYMNHIKWDYIQFKVFYSRRQAIRHHDEAVKKLVGQTVGEW